MPGAGFCCVFDNTGKMLKAKGVLNGDQECWADLAVEKNAANAGGTADPKVNWYAGLYWCTGPQANCFMRFWAGEHSK